MITTIKWKEGYPKNCPELDEALRLYEEAFLVWEKDKSTQLYIKVAEARLVYVHSIRSHPECFTTFQDWVDASDGWSACAIADMWVSDEHYIKALEHFGVMRRVTTRFNLIRTSE